MLEHLSTLYKQFKTIVNVRYYGEELVDCHRNHGHQFQDFIKFPGDHGWGLDDEYVLQEATSNTALGCKRLGKRQLLQAWIIFQLYRSFFSLDHENVHEHLIDERFILDTGALTNTAESWHRKMVEAHASDPGQAIWLLSRTNQLLELARKVVIANLSESAKLVQISHGDITAVDLEDLGLMVFGETLSGVLSHTIKRCEVNLPGWEPDDESGWGPSVWAMKEMNGKKMCPRSQKVLKGQLGRNATLLFVTVRANVATDDRPANETNIHLRKSNCNEEKCDYIQAATSADVSHYQPAHYPNCRNSGGNGCSLIGPNLQDVCDILKHLPEDRFGPFPLLRVTGSDEEPTIEVHTWTKGVKFATISHVWAQGLGNKTSNEILCCQLKKIRLYVKDVFSSRDDEFFWLDTLAIPQNTKGSESQERLKDTAISRIYHVFNEATHCIIFDRHLITTGTDFVECRTIASELLASAWMRRLWTLQEALVSKQLHVAVKSPEVASGSDRSRALLSIDTMWDNTKEGRILAHAINGIIQRKLFFSMMGRTRITSKSKDKAVLIADAWRGTRYRTIENADHETLVLASLLNIPIPYISSLQNPTGKVVSRLPNQMSETSERRELLMAEFWKLIGNDNNNDGSIPSGMIFLPGTRLSVPGFGWAPLTWMAHQEEPYPYPLSAPRYPTKLHHGKGLEVHCPGFILHASKEGLSRLIEKQLIITPEPGETRSFNLVVSRGLHEWYRVTDADTSNTSSAQDLVEDDLAQRLKESGSQPLRFGIILSRPRPVESPGEIGLLVELQKPRSQDMFYCRIIRRVEVSLIPPGGIGGFSHDSIISADQKGLHILQRYTEFGRTKIIGEAVADNQAWCVDGYIPKPQKDGSSGTGSDHPRHTSKNSGTKFSLPVPCRKAWSKLTRGR